LIPRAYIQAWSAKAPWPDLRQVEQDLIICRALCDLFNASELKGRIAFRGGTAIHKLLFEQPLRYSEDIDLVQTRAEPIGATVDAIRDALSWLGKCNRAQAGHSMHLVFKFAPESDPQTTLKLKVEVNTREHTSLHGLKSYPFAVDNDWYQAKAEIARGKATLEAVFSYLGRAFLVWRKGQWRRAWGWMELQEIRLDVGARLAAACDVPDLELFPMRYKGVQTVRFSAAREFGVQHLTLWCLAAFRRIGLPFPVARWAASLNRFAGMFDAAEARAR